MYIIGEQPPGIKPGVADDPLGLIESLLAERANLIHELAIRDDALAEAEREIDALRAALGTLSEVPA